MTGAAPALSAARPARTIPPERRITLPMRIALGFLHTGALYREPGNVWRCRAFPHEHVLDATAQAIERMGVAALREYSTHQNERRACLTLTEAGIALYARIGGQYAHRRPPPVQVECTLRETERAMAEMAAREARLSEAIAAIDTEARETRAASRRIEQSIARLEAMSKRFDHERATLASCRQDLRAFTTQAAERIGAAISEAGQ